MKSTIPVAALGQPETAAALTQSAGEGAIQILATRSALAGQNKMLLHGFASAYPRRRAYYSQIRKGIRTVAFACLSAFPAFGWVYPEHREIALRALNILPLAEQARLSQLWSHARRGYEARLCAQFADSKGAVARACIDYAAWTAIAGDHSCSARDMLQNIVATGWILRADAVGQRLNSRLADARRPDQRDNALRNSDFALTRLDPDYVARAGSNNAHFLLARSDVQMGPDAYAELALGTNAELNALGIYVWYHLRALGEATRIARDGFAPNRDAEAARNLLADEAFALHFLQDSFAAGHVAGTWGNSAVRKGTHDYYCRHGLEVVTWDNHRFVAMGDGYMEAADAERAANAVRDSLSQIVSALEGRVSVVPSGGSPGDQAESFDVCRERRFADVAGTREEIKAIIPVIVQTPVPALGMGQGELPRFHSELGLFAGLATGVNGSAQSGGFGSRQTDVSSAAGLDAAFRLGLGLEGVLNPSSDALVFLDLGVRQDSPTYGNSVPGRSAFTLRWRAPFWVIPGDLLLAAPVLALAAPKTLQKMAVQAANGGAIPWQAVQATRLGRFQLVLGREVGFAFYGYSKKQSVFLPTPGVTPLNATEVRLRSLRVDVPVLEWRLLRTFSMNQSSGFAIQFNVGFDKPTGFSIVQPIGAPEPTLKTLVFGGARIVFDWRRYTH